MLGMQNSTFRPLSGTIASILLKFEQLYDGTLGEWTLPSVSIHLKVGVKPFHGRPYHIPKVHKATLMKKIDRLVSIRVMKWQPYLQLASPSFIIPKKDLTVRTISDFSELNKSSDRIARLVNEFWLSRYPRCQYLVYDNGSEF
jgi:hypothetical protein